MTAEYWWVTTQFTPDTIGWRAVYARETPVDDTDINSEMVWIADIDPVVGWLTQEQRRVGDDGVVGGELFGVRVVPGVLFDEVTPCVAGEEGCDNLWGVISPGQDPPSDAAVARWYERESDRQRRYSEGG